MELDRRNAILSVSNKDGIADFGERLHNAGWKIYASGGTAKELKQAGIQVTDLAEIVGPPILGHRVVTLSREVHAGLVARNIPEDIAELHRLKIPWFDLLCVDFYPLEEEIKKPNATMESVIEKTDIGGPTMLRSAAKGRRLIASDVRDRDALIKRLRDGTGDDLNFRHVLAMIAERRVQEYCKKSADYIESLLLPKTPIR